MYIRTWDLSPSVIIWVPEGYALGHPYNYTRRQIPCSDVPVLQLICIIQLSSFQRHAFTMTECLSDDDFQPPKKRTRFALPSTSKELMEASKGVLPKNTEKMTSGLSVPSTSGLARETLSARKKIAVQQTF